MEGQVEMAGDADDVASRPRAEEPDAAQKPKNRLPERT
jgi:hypothetical protein